MSAFKFDATRNPVGKMLRYLKVGLDGGRPSIVSVYMASKTYVEVTKREPIAERLLAYVTASFDWDTVSLERIQAFHLYDDMQLSWQAVGAQVDDSFTMIVGGTERIDTTPLRLPAHNYNFDFISLNLSFPHLVRPTEDFEVGVYMPNFEKLALWGGDSSTVPMADLMRNDVAQVVYQGETKRENIHCRHYKITMFGATGDLWTDAAHGHWVDFEHPVPDNPAWNSLKLKLLAVQPMTLHEWQAYLSSELDAAETYTG